MKIAYFEPYSGIAGDMTVAALLDAAPDPEAAFDRLREALGALDLGHWQIALAPVEVNGLAARHFGVTYDQEHHHHHRHWKQIRAMIQEAGPRGLGEAVAARAVAIFTVLAEAEATVHQVEVEQVHFHEVGAVDSIIDIVAAAWCLEFHGIQRCYCGPIATGSGFVNTEHGRLAVPAPATEQLLRGLEISLGDGQGELTTPTGAAILAAEARSLRPSFLHQRSGVGAGTLRLEDRANVLRVFIGEVASGAADDSLANDDGAEVICIETDIDDMTAEALAYVADSLRAAGARDVSLLPLAMKKGRLGMRLTVLADLPQVETLASKILSETSSIGVRYAPVRRMVLPRFTRTVTTTYGDVSVKVVDRPDGRRTAAPEFEDVAALARTSGQPLHVIYDAAVRAFEGTSGEN